MNNAIIKPEWSFITIALMVLGFVIFWPLGLAMLAFILWGEKFGGSSDKAEAWVNSKKQWARNCRNERHGGHRSHRGYRSTSGNAAFDEYRTEQMKRLEEERRRLDEEVGQFHEYMRNLHMARDREEFDRFIKDRKFADKKDTPPKGDVQDQD